jgi:multiple sugar transport system ATP-binding protein
MPDIAIRGAIKVYPNGHLAVDNVDLDVADGEFLVLVGPSGCGKSTLLRLLAGLEEITAGQVLIGGRDVTDASPRARDVAMVFQSYALYPHMSVRKNIGYPLKVGKRPPAEIATRVQEVARLLELEEVLDRRPGQLSGGQRQRVAMGRAIIRRPSVFLMDEPLSNLDAQLRVQMRAEIARLQRTLGVTTVYVTHDQVEAMTMGTRVAVLDGGRLQQVDAPQQLYDHPANLFVATFIGSPRMNLFDGSVVTGSDGRLSLSIAGQQLALDDGAGTPRSPVAGWSGGQVTVGIRPEALGDAALDGAAGPEHTLEAEVELVESLGAELLVHLRLERLDKGARPFVARFPPRSTVRVGDAIKVVVDVSHLHFFDPATGNAIDRPDVGDVGNVGDGG